MNTGRLIFKLASAASIALMTVTLLGSATLAQTARQLEKGSLLSAAEIKRIAVKGLHLGMSPDRVEHLLLADGFQKESNGTYSNKLEQVWVDVSYAVTTDGQSLLSFTLNYNFSGLDDPQRVKFKKTSADLGKPTLRKTETLSVGPSVHEDFLFSSTRQTIGTAYEAANCSRIWKCQALQNIDCRKVFKQADSAVVYGYSGPWGASITAIDLAPTVARLMQDPAFVKQDISGANCMVATE